MHESLAEELGLPPIDQVAYVVHDLDRALQTFERLFGTFAVMESDLKGTLYRGKKADVKLRMGFGKSGPVEIELIEVVSGDSPHREILEKHGEGVHHIRFRVDDLDPPLDKLRKIGFEVIWQHEIPEVPARWVYLEGPEESGGALGGLLQLPG